MIERVIAVNNAKKIRISECGRRESGERPRESSRIVRIGKQRVDLEPPPAVDAVDMRVVDRQHCVMREDVRETGEKLLRLRVLEVGIAIQVAL